MNGFGRYELRDTLGHGGFATVYRAWDTVLHRDVALKAMHQHLASAPDLRARFLREARALARLRHPNIVAVHDAGEFDGRPFFTMDLYERGTLEGWTNDGSARSLDQILSVLRPLASALDYLHATGLIHRDVKAANVMLDDGGRPILMDFGIAFAADGTQHTRTGALLGSVGSMAPEQVRGLPVTPAADIYALGVLAYHLLGGQPPFVGDTAAILYAQVNEPPPPLRNLRPGLSDAAYAAIDAALAKDAKARPTNAGALIAVVKMQERIPKPPIPINSVPDRVSSAPRVGSPITRKRVIHHSSKSQPQHRLAAGDGAKHPDADRTSIATGIAMVLVGLFVLASLATAVCASQSTPG